jgi:hypothetical protein
MSDCCVPARSSPNHIGRPEPHRPRSTCRGGNRSPSGCGTRTRSPRNRRGSPPRGHRPPRLRPPRRPAPTGPPTAAPHRRARGPAGRRTARLRIHLRLVFALTFFELASQSSPLGMCRSRPDPGSPDASPAGRVLLPGDIRLDILDHKCHPGVGETAHLFPAPFRTIELGPLSRMSSRWVTPIWNQPEVDSSA